jgi:DNA polymerase I-like protein with 3'-5' exonuclease and polymerase domains
MKTYPLPRVRKIFIPDPGYVMFDADLSGADAQVVAWEANDEDLKAKFKAGLKVHDANAVEMLGESYINAPGDRGDKGTPKGRIYDVFKRRVHATNYGASARTLHLNPDIGGTLAENENFQRSWFSRHPGIREWHARVGRCLATDRTIRNQFGYRIIFYDRIDSIFPEALAWTPQSTVAEVCFRGALQLQDRCPWAEILIQVHDSLVFQVPSHRDDCIPQLRAALPNPVPYPDPLVIGWGLKSSPVSWGDCKEVPL